MARSTRPLFDATSLASPSRWIGIETTISSLRFTWMKSMCCTERFTGWRWMSLISVGYTVPSTVRSRIVFMPAAPDRAWRSSRRSTETASGSMPWPYTTAGILPSARRRRASELPACAPGFGLENGLRHGDRLPSDLVTAPTDRAPRRYSSIPIYRPSIASPPARPACREPARPHRKMRSIVHWAGSGPHISEIGASSPIDAGHLCRCGVRVVPHRLVESDDQPSDLAAFTIAVLVATLAEIATVMPRGAGFDPKRSSGQAMSR